MQSLIARFNEQEIILLIFRLVDAECSFYEVFKFKDVLFSSWMKIVMTFSI